MYVKSLFIALTTMVALMVNVGQAADVDVNTDTSWTDTTLFNTGDSIYVNSDATLTINGNLSDKTAGSVLLGDKPGGGTTGTGIFDLTASSKFNTDYFTVGSETAGTANLDTSSILTINDDLIIGVDAVGTINMDNGASINIDNDLIIGSAAGSAGSSITLDDSSKITVDNTFTVGSNAASAVTLDDSSTITTDDFILGLNAAGTLTMGSNTKLTADNLTIGSGATGTATLTNASLAIANDLIVGSGADSTLTINSSSVQNTANNMTIGLGAKGTVTLTDTTVTISNDLIIGSGAGSTDSTLIMNADATLTADSFTLGSNATGILTMAADSSLTANHFILGDNAAGTVTLADDATLKINSTVEFTEGTITNNGTLNLSGQTFTWNNTAASEIVFDGTGTTNIGANASEKYLTLQNGTLTTSGNLNANNFVLTSGTLQVAGTLTRDNFTTPAATIELLSGSNWTATSATQTGGTIKVSGGSLDLDFGLPSGAIDASTISMSSGVIAIHENNINLGSSADITGGGFDANGLGENTVSWSGGKVKGSVRTFFTDNYYVDDVNVNMSGDAELEVFDSGSGGYTVVYDFNMTGDPLNPTINPTVTGGPTMLLYVQAEGNITTLGGTNTANIEFMGRNKKSATINAGGATFTGDITIGNGVANKIQAGTFDGKVTIQNPGDNTTGTSEVIPAGQGVTTISGGTFNNTVTLDLYRETGGTTEDEENKVTISGGAFSALEYKGPADQNSTVLMGNAIINGGTFDSIELVAGSGSGVLTIGESISVTGAGGVKLDAAVLSLTATKNLTVTHGLLMDTGSTGTLAGSGSITGNVTQNAGTVNPGDDDNVGTIKIFGDANLKDVTIDLKGTTNDLIDVTETITLASDGTTTVKNNFSSTTVVEHDYTIMTATGGGIITGFTGHSVNMESIPGGFTASANLANSDHDLVISLRRAIQPFPAGAYNANNFANYLYALSAGGDHQNQLMAALASDTNQQLAAEKLSGEPLQTGLQALMNVGIMRLNTLTQQIRPSRNSQIFQNGLADNSEITARGQFDPHASFRQTRLWYTAYGMGGHIKGTEATSPAGVTFGGMMVGIEGCDNSGLMKVGVFYDGSGVETNESLLVAKTKVRTNYFGGYWTSEIDNGYRLLTFGFGEDRYTSQRYLDIGSGSSAITELANAGYHGWQSNLYAERGWGTTQRLFGAEPFLGLQYSYIRRNGFEETASTAMGSYTNYAMLDMESANYNSLRTYIGARWETPFYELGNDPKSGLLLGGSFQVQTIWIHEMLDKLAPINNAQLGASTLSNSFLVEGADCGRDWYLMSLGTKWRLSKAFSFYGDYSILVNAQQTFHTGSGGVCLTW